MAQWLGWAALSWAINGICQGLAVTALVWALIRLSARANAATRYGVWWASLAAVAALCWAPPALPGPARAEAPLVSLPAPGSWPLWLLGAWAAAAILKLARLGGSYLSIQRLKGRAVAAPAEVEERFTNLLRRFPGRRAPRLGVSAEIAVPMAAGLWRPAILLPARLIAQLSGEELEQILAHELAHLRRGDDWTNLAQKVMEALLVFHPAVWFIGRRLNMERELACDDWVVALTGQPRPYAACLTKVAGLGLAGRRPQLAPGAVAKKRQLIQRVEALLERRRRGSPRFRKGLAATACALLAAAAAAGRFAPVAVAQPEVAALPAGGPAAAAPVRLAYAAPPVRRPDSPRHREVKEFDYVQASYCIFYYEGNHSRWLRIIWVGTATRPAAKRA